MSVFREQLPSSCSCPLFVRYLWSEQCGWQWKLGCIWIHYTTYSIFSLPAAFLFCPQSIRCWVFKAVPIRFYNRLLILKPTDRRRPIDRLMDRQTVHWLFFLSSVCLCVHLSLSNPTFQNLFHNFSCKISQESCSTILFIAMRVSKIYTDQNGPLLGSFLQKCPQIKDMV